MAPLEPHYEIRQIIINRQLKGAPVTLNVGIRYRDTEGKQVGPDSGRDVTLDGPQFTRADPTANLTLKEDVVLAAAKVKLGTQNVTLVDPPIPEDEE